MLSAKKTVTRSVFSAALFSLFVVAQGLAQVPPSDHVFVLMEENHSYEQVVGNTNMPYLNSLINSNGLATNYDANSHYSIPNYFWITTGQSVTTYDPTQAVFNVDNVTRYLSAAGKTWKAYEESIPSAGYTGPTVEPYEKNHDPFSYLTDVVNSSQSANIVPFTQLATDVANNQLPNFGFITPNSNDDGHTANLAAADKWLSTNLKPLLASPAFQPGGNGVLIITFDESLDTDCRPLTTCPKLPENSGGGRVATVVIGPNVKSGYQSTKFYQHPSVLRTMLLVLGINGAPGAAQNAPSMDEFFGGSSSQGPCVGTGANQTVTICTPSSGQTLASPVHVTAAATDSQTVKYIEIWVDGVKQYIVPGGTLDTLLPMTSGTHRFTVQANDGVSFKSTIYITVQ
jgi:acid phosphatase